MRVFRTVQQMRKFSDSIAKKGRKTAFVPTMGCLHEGHLSLIETARKEADAVVVSIFVNPVQFGQNEDFSKYPRTEEEDLKACRKAGVSAVFLPAVTEIFPEGFSTYVSEESRSNGLCGAFRPGHFRGVATIVLMLFNIVRPHVAIFGQKDAQQAAVLRKMAADLFIPVKIRVAPVSREADGLARSSRNRYLSAGERAVASELYAALQAGRAAAHASGLQLHPRIITDAVATHLARHPQFKTQYIALVDAETMRPVQGPVSPKEERLVLAAAVHLGKTRLIDNILL
ncbi:MAG: pantoate--beta-alanine ligase [Puniceicoccales bacterium]|jgi:pantoate--beta-alanine ligase|nr:pantoate--beta-alanine ligase [Puniceicoccales bacterium]